MYSDSHIHCQPDADGEEILKAMRTHQMQKAVLVAPQMTYSDEDVVESIGTIARVCAPNPDRLIGFAYIEPTLPGAVEHVQMAADKELRGIKMMPDGWYPYEERLFPVYEKAQELRMPILFHSGIQWSGGDSSRCCRPVNFEVMVRFPKVKFALAHMGWPWTTECLALAGRFRAAAARRDLGARRSYVDLAAGVPDMFQREALQQALRYVGPGRLMFGSDDRVPGNLTASRHHLQEQRNLICDELGYVEDDFQQIAQRNLEDFLTPLD